MKFISLPIDDAIPQIAGAINNRLQTNDRLLLLLSGGSNIEVAVRVRELLDVADKTITVGLIDERYGDVGHSDSNWEKLIEAGFDFTGITQLPVLIDALDLVDTATRYNDLLEAQFSSGAMTVGILGLGSDGHTAGILPHSDAVDASGLVTSYPGPDYLRVTLTPGGLNKLNQIYLVAYGESKHHQLNALKTDQAPSDQPAQLLKTAPDVVIYNDLEGTL